MATCPTALHQHLRHTAIACHLGLHVHLGLFPFAASCRLECLERLGDEDGIWVWKRINALFNWLPLAALIEGKILCMHGGIGRCINRIEQIAELERPITMEVRQGGLIEVHAQCLLVHYQHQYLSVGRCHILQQAASCCVMLIVLCYWCCVACRMVALC